MLLALTPLGCAGGDGFHVSGAVTFDGKPVPEGRITFTPDATKDNRGPQGYAPILDGRYDSRRGGRATAGGPMVVSITGADGGRPLFIDYEMQIDLPRETTTKDFNVPAEAAKSVPTDLGPPP